MRLLIDIYHITGSYLPQATSTFATATGNWEVHPETGCVQFKYCPPAASCGAKVAPKNCLWSDWTWESCSATCGGGIQNGTRTVAQPAEYGGSECTGPSTSTQRCNTEDCPGPCPEGYTLKPGDVPGWGTISGRHSAATVEDCTAICDQNDRCCSVEWSPTEKLCNLNKECKPTARLYKDYLLCSNSD